MGEFNFENVIPKEEKENKIDSFDMTKVARESEITSIRINNEHIKVGDVVKLNGKIASNYDYDPEGILKQGKRYIISEIIKRDNLVLYRFNNAISYLYDARCFSLPIRKESKKVKTENIEKNIKSNYDLVKLNGNMSSNLKYDPIGILSFADTYKVVNTFYKDDVLVYELEDGSLYDANCFEEYKKETKKIPSHLKNKGLVTKVQEAFKNNRIKKGGKHAIKALSIACLLSKKTFSMTNLKNKFISIFKYETSKHLVVSRNNTLKLVSK